MDDLNDHGIWKSPPETTPDNLNTIDSKASIAMHSQQTAETHSEKADAIRVHSPTTSDKKSSQEEHPCSSLGSSSIDHGVVALITEEVIKQLASRYSVHVASPGPTSTSSHLPHTPISPDFSSVASFPRRYTPPSPRRGHDETFDVGDGSISPRHQAGVGPVYPNSSKPENDRHSQTNDATPRPVPNNKPHQRRYERESSCTRSESMASTDTANFMRRRSFGVDSGRSFGTVSTHTDEANSCESPGEITALEKAWQPLFKKGYPTARLSQFLRGLAKHLIDDFEPKGSLVVTPAKMLRFFEETVISGEVYPWLTIYGKMKHTSICTMYRKLLCQHHLIQNHIQEAPTVPGLTPTGFEALMTCLIQAHPEIEFQRLAKAVKNMPISNADDPRERFPKELSRRLFPSEGEVQAEQRLISSLSHEMPLVNLEHAAATMPPPPSRPPPPRSPYPERGRDCYPLSNRTSISTDGDSESPPVVQIERERKPYYAKEGSGKRYDTDDTKEREQDHDRGVDRSSTVQQPNLTIPQRTSPGLRRSSSYKSSSRPYQHNVDPNRKPGPPSFPPISKSAGLPSSARRSSTPPRYNYPPNDYRGFPLPHYNNNNPIEPIRDTPPEVNIDNRRYTDSQPLERARTTNDTQRFERNRTTNDGYPLDRARTTNDDDRDRDRDRSRPKLNRNASQGHN